MTSTLHESAPPQSPERSRNRRIAWYVGGIALIAALVAIGLIVFRDDSSSSGSLAAKQMASINHACQQWTAGSAPALEGRSASETCTAMSDWMNQQLQNGHMTSGMMWSSAATMRATCEQWMATSHPAVGATTAQSWCGSMTSWIAGHIGDWPDWMDSGHMMGR